MASDSSDTVNVSEREVTKIRERVLQAEKEKLHLDLPRGIINDVEQIIREEIDTADTTSAHTDQ